MGKILEQIALNLLILLFIRLGSHIPVPQLNSSDLNLYIASHLGRLEDPLLNIFFNDSGIKNNLFSLSIFPYITASIVVQVLSNIIPKIKKYKKEGELEGRRYIAKLTRFITFFFAVFQSYIVVSEYDNRALGNDSLLIRLLIIFYLTTGSMILVWVSEWITEYGVGNGSSVIILANIIQKLPERFLSISENVTAAILVFSFASLILNGITYILTNRLICIFFLLLCYVSHYPIQGHRFVSKVSSDQVYFRRTWMYICLPSCRRPLSGMLVCIHSLLPMQSFSCRLLSIYPSFACSHSRHFSTSTSVQ